MARARFVRLLLVALAAGAAGAVGSCGGGGGGSVAPPSSDAALASLVVSAGTLAPAFDPDTTTYTVGPDLLPASVTVRPTARASGATITVAGAPTASGAASAPLALPEGLQPISVEVTAPDGVTLRTYSVVFNRVVPAQEGYLKASNTQAGDRFGDSIAISGTTLVVGAPREDSAATGVNGTQADESAAQSGAAYVFVRVNGAWVQQAYLKASNAGAGDGFGAAVAIDGDTIVVGAPSEASAATGVDGDGSDNTATQAGAAYVFVRSGTAWSQQAYLKASNTDRLDTFGASVAIAGDTVVVGAWGEASSSTGVDGVQSDDSAPGSGAAYVFVRNGTAWSQQAYLKASNTGASDYFGESVAISGDTVVVGAWGESSSATGVNGLQSDDSASLAGAAYVFVRSGTAWSQQAYLKASNTDAEDYFGTAVAVADDTVVVGAVYEDGAATGVDGDGNSDAAADAGAAYVFARNGTTWTQQAYLKASNTGANDRFGTSVSVAGEAVLVGAPGESSAALGIDGIGSDNSRPSAGAAYVFVRSGTSWTHRLYVKASNTSSSDSFGSAVAVAGGTAVIAAPGEASTATGVDGNQLDENAPEAGAAYVFR